MKRFLIALTAAATLALPVAAVATPPGDDGEHKVAICHRTASDTNPYVYIEVDEASLSPGHLDNADPGHKPTYWKSDGVFRGVAHSDGDPKDDYLAPGGPSDCEDFPSTTTPPVTTSTTTTSTETTTTTPPVTTTTETSTTTTTSETTTVTTPTETTTTTPPCEGEQCTTTTTTTEPPVTTTTSATTVPPSTTSSSPPPPVTTTTVVTSTTSTRTKTPPKPDTGGRKSPPGPLAFTGLSVENVVHIVAAALLFAIVGSYLLWLGGRRREEV